MNTGLFTIIYLMWGVVDSPVGKPGLSDLTVVDRARRHPDLGLMFTHVCSCLVLCPRV